MKTLGNVQKYRILLASICLLPGLLFAWPCHTSFTTYSQLLTIMNTDCQPDIHSNAVMLDCGSYHQTTTYTCGPAAVMTLMHCYGLLDQKDMNHSTEMRIADEMGATKGRNGGTTAPEVAAWLSNHGFSVDYGEDVTADMIIENIKKGVPTLLGFSNHWMLATGYNPGVTPAGDEIIFTDSSYNINLIPRDVIDSMWAESKISMNNAPISPGIYIVAIPEK